jgi:hypothetical protein
MMTRWQEEHLIARIREIKARLRDPGTEYCAGDPIPDVIRGPMAPRSSVTSGALHPIDRDRLEGRGRG